MFNKSILVSEHAKDRFLDFFPELNGMDRVKVIGIMMAMYYNGCLYGGQLGKGYLVLAKNNRNNREVVFACDVADDKRFIKTVLTKDHASANMALNVNAKKKNKRFNPKESEYDEDKEYSKKRKNFKTKNRERDKYYDI